MNFIKLTTLILLLPLSSFSQSKNLEINDFFDFKITRYLDYNNNIPFYDDDHFTDSTFIVPEGKLWKINYFGIGFRKNNSPWNIGEPTFGNFSVFLDGALIYNYYNYDGGGPSSSDASYEKKCPIWLNSGEHKIIIDHEQYAFFDWVMKLNLSIVEFNITEN